MLCKNGEIPTYIPSDVTELFIEKFDFNQLSRNQFKDVSNIQKLDIQAESGKYIPSKSFDQFVNLTYLGLHGKDIEMISPDVFLGLNKCLTLNLSSNPSLQISGISSALNSENRGLSTTILPELLSLSVAKIKTSFPNPVDLNDYFFKSITLGRKLKYLDISDLNILMLNFDAIGHICKTVEYVDLRKSVTGNFRNFIKAEACESLRTIDISEAVLPALRIKFTFETLNFFCESLNFYTFVEKLLATNINTEHNIEINDYFLDMLRCPLQLKKVSFAGNKMKWLNMTVQLHQTTKQSISEINISYNGLEYISPSVLQPSVNMRILDFSHNELHVMQEKYTEEFERLFWALTKLYYLNISHNSLSNLPMQMFKKSRSLKILDISYNRVSSLHFSIKHLGNLEKLIARHNKIYIIEQNVRTELQILLQGSHHNLTHRNGKNKKHFHVYLEANPFQCTCDSVNEEFIEWLHYTEVIDGNETITCMLDDNIKVIRNNALKETVHFCRMQTIKKIAMIATPSVIIAVILGVFAFVRIRKRRKNGKRLREVIAQIEAGTFPLRYLAFLSYCSEDADLVLKKIYPELCKHLSEMTHSNEQMVCIGDKHFQPGYSLICEVMRCVEESSVFVAIISKMFCRKKMCKLEIKEAYEQNKPILMLMIEHVDKELMDNFLQKIFDRFAHAAWKPDQNGGHIEPEWNIFCKSIIQLSGKDNTHAY
ncbi:toll-like receptor 6 [Mercenaria mercenaria]|uniref:toll-like receptor 6 n=1 Tax=Mercenaria mercenaria TaxID=6596 RepID=UPI00234E584E|nr:toll-like receptor 6 [Mercenaria mercenaria]